MDEDKVSQILDINDSEKTQPSSIFLILLVTRNKKKASDVGIKYIVQVMVNREKSCEHLFRWRVLSPLYNCCVLILQPSDRLPGQRHTSHSIDVHEQMQGAWRKLKRLYSIYISAG